MLVVPALAGIIPGTFRPFRPFRPFRLKAVLQTLAVIIFILVWPGNIGTVLAQDALPRARQAFPDLAEADWNELAAAGRIDPNHGRLARMIVRLSNISQSNWQAYREESQSLAAGQIGESGSVFRLSGIGQTVRKITLDENLQQVFEFKALYVIEGINDEGSKFVVVTQVIPEPWKQASIAGQPLQCWSCLTTVRGDGTAILISPGIEWYPDRVSTRLGIDQAKVDLAAAGLDIGNLNQIKNLTGQAFSPDERTLFESLMSALKHLELNHPATRPAEFNLLGALQTPGKFAGSYVELQGTVRRVTPIHISSAELKRTLGRNSYFHVDLFLPIGNQSFSLKDAEGEYQIFGSYGVTLIVLDWPFSADEEIADQEIAITIPGYFIKNWKHKTVASREVSRELRRPNPIVFGIASLAKINELGESRDQSIEMTLAWFWGGLAMLVGLLTGLPWLHSIRRRREVDKLNGESKWTGGSDSNAGVSLEDHLRQFEDSQELRQSDKPHSD